MSIAMAPETPKSKHREYKSEKKHRSHHDKKRKREDREESKHKSKKHRSHKHAEGNLDNSHSNSQSQLPSSSKSQSSLTLKESPFHTQRATLYLPLSPILQRHPLEGICAEHLSPLILQYYPPLGGVVLSYSNPSLSEQPFGDDGNEVKLLNIDEFAVGWAWVTADFMLLKPAISTTLKGFINLQNESYLGIVCWNLFSASISRERLPKSWKWIGVADETADANDTDNQQIYAENGAGYFVDEDGEKLEGKVTFRIKEIETGKDGGRSFLTIVGTMLDDEQERALTGNERTQKKPGKDNVGRRLGGSRAIGATALGAPVDQERESQEQPGRKQNGRTRATI